MNRPVSGPVRAARPRTRPPRGTTARAGRPAARVARHSPTGRRPHPCPGTRPAVPPCPVRRQRGRAPRSPPARIAASSGTSAASRLTKGTTHGPAAPLVHPRPAGFGRRHLAAGGPLRRTRTRPGRAAGPAARRARSRQPGRRVRARRQLPHAPQPGPAARTAQGTPGPEHAAAAGAGADSRGAGRHRRRRRDRRYRRPAGDPARARR